MSWKGFKKAINRLPHLVQTKTGNAEESQDEEFDIWNSQLQELDQLSGRLVDASQKYKEALAAMLKHQESFAKTLLEVYQPIPGKFSSVESLGIEDSLAFTKIPKKDRPLTPNVSLQRAQDFYDISAQIFEMLTSKLDTDIDRQVLKPSMDYVMLHKSVQKTIVKRNHKKIDYDRHNNQFKKMKERVSDSEDERKILKMESSVESSFKEYEQINSLLKTQLPIYVQKRIDFMDPILESMILFQDYYFSTLCSHLEPLTFSLDMSSSAVEGYHAKKEASLVLLNEISVLKQLPKKVSATNVGSPVATDEEFDADVKRMSINDEKPPMKPTRGGSSGNAVPPPAYQNPWASTEPSLSPVKKSAPQVKPKPSFLASPPQQTTNPFQTQSQKAPPPTPFRRSRAKVLFDFDAQQPGDLALKTGEVVEVIEKTDDPNAWWKGKIGNREGLFPGTYVQSMD